MQHRGTARRRVLIASAETALPAPGTEIVADGRAVGTLGTVVGDQGWRSLRIDRVKDALDAGAADHRRRRAASRSRIPPCANFTFPQETAGAEEA